MTAAVDVAALHLSTEWQREGEGVPLAAGSQVGLSAAGVVCYQRGKLVGCDTSGSQIVKTWMVQS